MRRREVVAGLVGAAAWPLAAPAQPAERSRRVGVLVGIAESDPDGPPRKAALRQGLEQLGWIEGRNIVVDWRWAPDRDEIPGFAGELAALKPDVVIGASTAVALALKREAGATPVLFLNVTDPVGVGLAASLARPGGSSTGLTHFEPGMGGKWLDLLKQVAPATARVAVLYSPKTLPPYGLYMRAIEAAAPSFAIAPVAAPASDAAEIERALDGFGAAPGGGLVVLPDITTSVNRRLIVALAARHRLPAVYPFPHFTDEGGLMSYGVDIADQFRQLATYVDRILKGVRPGDLPVQTPTRFELVVNLRTAKALGLSVPPAVLVGATGVID